MKRKVVCALIASMILSVAAPAAVHAEVLPTTMVSEEAASEEAPEETAESLAEAESEEAEAESTEAGAESAEAESAEAESAEAESPEAEAGNEETKTVKEEAVVEDESAGAQAVGAASAIATKTAAKPAEDDKTRSLDEEFFDGKEGIYRKENDIEETASVLDAIKARTKVVVEDAIGFIVGKVDYLGLAGGTLKELIVEAYGLGSEEPTRAIEKKLDDLDFKMDLIEASIKRHTGNIIALNSLGGLFGTLKSRAESLGTKVKDIYHLYNVGKITREEKLARIGELYSSSEYTAAVNAFNDATKAYVGDMSIELGKVSIFGAAYNKQAEDKMFSGEVIDAVTPYLVRQMTTYIRAYGAINEVLDAYQLSKGLEFGTSSRESLDQKMKTVMGRYEEFYNTDRDVFIDGGNCSIRLKKQLLVRENYGKSLDYNRIPATPSFMKENPLNAEQVKHLAEYAAKKGKTIFEYLVNDMKFQPVRVTDEEKAERTAQGIYDVQNVYPFEPADMTKHIVAGHPYLAAGAQNLKQESGMTLGSFLPLTVYMQAVAMDQVGAGIDKIDINDNYGSAVDADLLFFLAA